MVAQLTGAIVRAFLVATLLATPSLVLPSVATDTAQIVVIIAILSGALIFVEYNSRTPSIIEFRFAPPYNRLKFGFLAASVFILSMVARGKASSSSVSTLLTDFSHFVGGALDFPYSPVRLVLMVLPANSDPVLIETVRCAAAVSYAASLIMVICFALIVRIQGWPVRNSAFNVWVNLPLFDPTAGGDVVHRLNRDSGINVSLGFLLPFLLPAIAYALSGYFGRSSMFNQQSLIWITNAWAFLPASMVMRGIATSRISELIRAKRRLAYAQAESKDGLQTA